MSQTDEASAETAGIGPKGVVRRARVTWRAVVIGLVASAALVAITPFNDFLVAATYIAGNHFPIGGFLVLLLLTFVANVVLRRLAPRFALSPAELATVWVMIVVPSGIPSSGLMRYLIPMTVSFDYYANPANAWEETLGPHLPDVLVIHNEGAVWGFFEGLRPGASIPWGEWVRPLAVWGIYVVALYAMLFALSVLLRRRWVEEERFTFPLVQVPVDICEAPEPGRLLNSFLRNKLLWTGIAAVTIYRTLGGLNRFFPSVPVLYRTYTLRLPDRPWSFAGSASFFVYPLIIGFAYLLTSEVSFSMWFFYLFYKLQCVLMGSLGLPMTGAGAGYGGFKWAVHEEAGATLALAIWFFWMGRASLRRVFRKGLFGDPSTDDSDEPLSYRMTVVLFVLGMITMVAWLTYFGGSMWLALANVILGLAVFVTLAWMVAQAGLVFLQPTFASTEVMTNLFGSGPFGTRALLVNVLNEEIFRMDLREYVLPSLLNQHKLTDPIGIDRRSLAGATVLSLVVAMFVSGWAAIRLPYLHGGGVALNNPWTYIMAPVIPYRWVGSVLNSPAEPDWSMIGHFGGGLAGILLLLWLRSRLTWFTLHPIGFVIASGYPASTMWFSMFIGWVLKSIIARYGGYKGYQLLRPIFMGLIIGDCLNGAAWIVIGLITRVGYSVLPG